MSVEATKTGVASDIAEGEPTDYTELTVSRSYNIRTDVEWPRAIRAFNKNPLLGTGYSSITDATDNDYLRSLGETGLMGTFSLSLIFCLLLFTFIKAMKRVNTFERLFLIAVICATINILITAVFIDVLEASKIASLLWIMLGVSWAVATGYKHK
jgi:O-antigen ligase